MSTIDDYFEARDSVEKAKWGRDHHLNAADVAMGDALIPDDGVDPDYDKLEEREGREIALNTWKGYVAEHMEDVLGVDWDSVNDKYKSSTIGGNWGITPGMVGQHLENMGREYGRDKIDGLVETEAGERALKIRDGFIEDPVAEATTLLNPEEVIDYTGIGQDPFNVTPDQLADAGGQVMRTVLDFYDDQGAVTPKFMERVGLYEMED